MSNHAARHADHSCLESKDPQVVKRCITKAERGAIDASRARYQETPAMPIETPNSANALPPHGDDIMAMSLEELRELQAKYESKNVRPQWSPQDQIEGITAAFTASALDRKAGPDLHPIANARLASGHVGLLSLAVALGEAVQAPMKNATANEILALGMSTPHLNEAIIATVRAVLHARPAIYLPAIQAITTDVTTPDYRPQGFGLVDIDLRLPDAVSTGEFLTVMPNLAAQEIARFSTFARLIISEQLLVNDDRNFLPAAVRAFAASAARAEIQGITQILEANQLPDERPLFDASNGNALTGTDLDSTGLGKAFAALRSQSTETGQPAGSAPRALLVHPDDEVAALELTETLPQNRRPHVIVLPHLSSASTWYLIANPTESPALARIRSIGSEPSAVSTSGISPAAWKDKEGRTQSTPGIAVNLDHHVGLAAVSPIGIVRCAKS